MTSGSLRIRPYRAGDEEGINAAFNRVFGKQRSLAEWHWKFRPWRGRRWIFVAEEREKGIVAHFAALPVEFQIDGRRRLVGQVVDAFSLRRSGLARTGPFARLVRAFFGAHGSPEDLALVYGFPGERHFRLGMLELGYSPPEPVSLLVRETGGEEVIQGRECGGWRVHEGLESSAVAGLWSRAAGRYPVAAVRDGTWLARRFEARPGVAYLPFAAVHDGEVEALAVLRVEGRVIRWAELVWDGRHREALAAIDRKVEELARLAGAERSELWLRRDPAAEGVLLSRGWSETPHPQGLAFGAVSFSPGIEAAEITRRMYLTLGDSDLA